MTVQEVKDYFRAMTIIYYGLLVGQMIFAATSTLIVSMEGGLLAGEEGDLEYVFRIVVPAVLILAPLIGNYMANRQLANASGLDLSQKLELYRSTSLTRLSTIQGPSFLSIIAYLLTGDAFYFIFTALAIGMFLRHVPSASKFSLGFDLATEEAELVRQAGTK